MRQKTRRYLTGIGIVAALNLSALAGSATYDFNNAPPPDLNFVGNAEWRPSGGVNDSGYMALFDAINSQYAGALIPDFDNGLIVRAFTFECDLRVGNAVGNAGRPADGFSISYARASDPVVADLDQEPPVVNWNNYSIPSAPEGGTTTGLSICFDTWQGNTWPSGETDIEGIILRVDNVTKARVPMATRNGECNDATSLQTGPYDGLDTGLPDDLCWAPLKVQLAENGEVTVTWKGTVIVDKVQTGFLPSAGRLVLAGRTGGANENTHVDNIKITTIPADKALVTAVAADALGITLKLEDNGQSVVDLNTVVVKADGVTLDPITKNKVDKTTTVHWNSPSLLASGRQIAVNVEFKDTLGAQISDTRTATVDPYFLLSKDVWTAPGTGDSTKPGLKARVWQVDQPGTVSLANRTHRAEQELAGIIGPNVADLTGAAGGLFDIDLVNWNQDWDTAEIGNFQTSSTPSRPDAAIPGIPGTGTQPNDSIAAEVIAYVELPSAGYYTMGVNSDDGFKVTATDTPPVHNLALVVTGAASAAGTYHAVSGPATTSKPFTGPLSGALVYMDPADGCDPPVNTEALRGKIALVDRGTCQFSAKIKNAKDAGAIGVVVVNNRTDDLGTWPEGIFPIEMGLGDAGYQDIPAVMISNPDGEKVKSGLVNGVTVSLTPDETPAVGEFDGGRGSADTTFKIFAPKAGVYPFRCVWYEGGGGANLEWFTVTATGEKILVNDRENPAALKSFRARTAQPVPSLRDYGIGLNFGADEANGNKAGTMAAADEAGVPSVAQANWNNLSLLTGSSTTVVGDADGVSQPTAATVSWTSANTWASTGRGEENNKFTGADKTLMLGYLDTGAATTSSVTLQNLPEALTSKGYDVYVYLLGGVANKGGGYRIVDANSGVVLKDYVKAQCSVNPAAHVQAIPAGTTPGTGTYILFSGLASPNITVEATTAGGIGFGSNPRAPINAVQLVSPPSSTPPASLTIHQDGSNVVVTWAPTGGTLESAPSVTGPWTAVAGATSPYTTIASAAAQYFRVRN